MIKCNECEEEISQESQKICSNCGAAIIQRSFWDINKDGKVDFDDLKAAVGNVYKAAKSMIPSEKNKYQEHLANLEKEFAKCSTDKMSDSQLMLNQFSNTLISTIELKISEILTTKPDNQKYLVYVDAQIITATVHNIFLTALSYTPRQISASCALSKAILAPTVKAKGNLFKAAVGFSGGTIGIGMIIGAVGGALGWGASITTAITTIFVTTSFLGPIAWGVGGLGLAGVVGYFASKDNDEENSERFIKALVMSLEEAIKVIWAENSEALTKSLQESQSKSNNSQVVT
ncbi:MAG: hypothetical protein JKY55_14030 [Aliivibrio sp.]|uniref:hypothetical protein n=1 Tax=Aliivibrio sp. TaxID=1872443 RepID=UPI001A4B4BC8|nr:hypothetical protein [Aliivibrio sp.]